MTMHNRKIRFAFPILLVLLSTSFVSAQTPQNWWRIVTPATSGVQSEIDALPQTPEQNLKLPVLIGIAPGSFKNNYGITYSNGSVHQGEDIFAPRGAYVVSPTVAVVTRVDLAGAGGIAVYTANPGNETFYYAHLTAVGPTIHVGAQLQAGDLIGYVGNTGDAEGASTHLHFQIFEKDTGVIDPNPRLTQTFSEDERIGALNTIISRSSDRQLAANAIVNLYRTFLTSLSPNHAALAPEITTALGNTPLPSSTPSAIASSGSSTTQVLSQQTVVPTVAAAPVLSTPTVTTHTPSSSQSNGNGTTISQDLSIGMRNDTVKVLQQYLINKHVGTYGTILATYGATGYYGVLTKSAVIEFQRSVGISASGFCGPITRAYIASHS